MTKVTEKDVIIFLENKVISLRKELTKTEIVLAAIRNTSEKPTNQTLGNVRSGAKRGRKSLKSGLEISPKMEDVIQVPKTSTTRKKRPKDITATESGRQPGNSILTAPAAYTTVMTMQNKVAFALGKLVKGTKDDVKKVLTDLEHGADPSKLHRDVTVKLSDLLSKGRIKADKSRRPYTYSLL